jgi:1-acyl-sn-glycerol-3-phosphate acyltransferase
VKVVLVLLKACIVGVLAGLAGVVVILTTPFDKRHDVYFWIARTHSRITLKLFGITVDVRGGENIVPGRPYVYATNHASLFDIPAAVLGIPDRVHIVYKKELERIPLFGWGLKIGGVYIGIDRGRGAEAVKSLEKAVERIRNGASVLLFAEGTRTKDGKLQPFKRGAFNLAVRAGVAVVPVTINGSYRILPRETLRVNPGTITLVIDKPIEIREDGKEQERKLMETVYKVIENHYVETS